MLPTNQKLPMCKKNGRNQLILQLFQLIFTMLAESNKEDVLRFLSERKEELFRQYQLTKLGIFGSFARGEANASSDIDIIVEFKPHTADIFNKKRELRNTLRQVFNKDIDICREKYIKPYFKSQILASAIYV